MENFGPAVSFCERLLSYMIIIYNALLGVKLSIIRNNSNRRVPSRDIAINFSILEYLRHFCSTGGKNGLNCCMKKLYNSPSMQQFLNDTTPHDLTKKKTIYKHGKLRNVTDSSLN